MHPLKIGLRLTSLRQPFKQALLTAARLGAQAVEIDARTELKPAEMSHSALRHVRKLLEDHNLRVCAVSFSTRHGYNVTEQLDRRIEATKAALQMAYDLGASVVVNQVGQIPTDGTGPDWELLLQSLSDLGRYSHKVGAWLAARTGSEDPTVLGKLIDALPVGSLGVDLDPGGLIINAFSPREAVQILGRHVMHMHARDGVRDLARGRGLEVQVGRGSVDFPELLGALEEHAYRGYVTLEREFASDPLQELGQGIEFLRNI